MNISQDFILSEKRHSSVVFMKTGCDNIQVASTDRNYFAVSGIFLRRRIEKLDGI